MGVHHHVYKLNPKKIKSNLPVALVDGTMKPSFIDYLKAQNEDTYSNKYLSEEALKSLELTKILSALADIEAYGISANIGIALGWLESVEVWLSPDEDDPEEILSYYGFEQIFELRGRGDSWIYREQFYDYINRNDLAEPVNFEGYMLIPNKLYKDYLVYLLTVLKAVCLDTEYPDSPINQYPDLFVNNFELPDIYQIQAASRLTEIRQMNLEEDMAEEANLDRKQRHFYHRYNCHYYVADQLFYDVVKLHQTLEDYKGKIMDSFSC